MYFTPPATVSQDNSTPSYDQLTRMRESIDQALTKDPSSLFNAPRRLPRLNERYVDPFPVEFLGPVATAAAEAIAAKKECAVDIAAQSILGAMSLGTCGHYDVRHPHGKLGSTNLFLLTVGRSSDRKSSADSVALEAVRRWEKALARKYADDMPSYVIAMEAWERNRKKVVNETLSPLQRAGRIGKEPKRPLPPMLTVDEPTVEGLRDSFLRGSKVLGLFGDEGGTFLGGHSMQAEKRLGAISQISKMWDSTAIKKMRAGGIAQSVHAYRLAAHLMIQPVLAEEFLSNRLYLEQGLLSRFLVAWPDLTEIDGQRFDKEDDPAHDAAIAKFQEWLYDVLQQPLPLDASGDLDPRLMTFSTGARTSWGAFKNDTQKWLAPGGEWYSIRGFGEKALEHCTRVAVTLQAFQERGSELRVDWFDNAVNIVHYYINQLLSLESGGNDPLIKSAHLLHDWLTEKYLHEFVSTGVILQSGPRSLRRKSALMPVIEVLQEYGLLEQAGPRYIETPDGEDRVKESWRIHQQPD